MSYNSLLTSQLRSLAPQSSPTDISDVSHIIQAALSGAISDTEATELLSRPEMVKILTKLAGNSMRIMDRLSDSEAVEILVM